MKKKDTKPSWISSSVTRIQIVLNPQLFLTDTASVHKHPAGIRHRIRVFLIRLGREIFESGKKKSCGFNNIRIRVDGA